MKTKWDSKQMQYASFHTLNSEFIHASCQDTSILCILWAVKLSSDCVITLVCLIYISYQSPKPLCNFYMLINNKLQIMLNHFAKDENVIQCFNIIDIKKKIKNKKTRQHLSGIEFTVCIAGSYNLKWKCSLNKKWRQWNFMGKTELLMYECETRRSLDQKVIFLDVQCADGFTTNKK